MEFGRPATRDERWGTRVLLRHPVTIRWEDHARTGTLHTVSVSGGFVEVPFPYPLGATLNLSFLLDPEAPPVVIDGKVVMRNLGGIGIRFLHQGPDTPLTLKRWLDAHAPARPSIHRAA
jgi:hypothetical protein